MTEGAPAAMSLRKGERLKKPSRFLQLDDMEFGNTTIRATPISTAPTQETPQVGKLLIKFLNSLNKKAKQAPKTAARASQSAQPHSTPQLAKPPHEEGRTERTARGSGQGARRAGRSSIQPDIDYHSQLTQHVRHVFPNIQDLNPEMLSGLSIPSKMTQGTSKSSKKTQQEKNKVFKRQSYHLAVAYQIHVSRCLERGVDNDPTIPARRMRAGQK